VKLPPLEKPKKTETQSTRTPPANGRLEGPSSASKCSDGNVLRHTHRSMGRRVDLGGECQGCVFRGLDFGLDWRSDSTSPPPPRPPASRRGRCDRVHERADGPGPGPSIAPRRSNACESDADNLSCPSHQRVLTPQEWAMLRQIVLWLMICVP
jgi:hypothetical protein